MSGADDLAMTGAELWVARGDLGVSVGWLAARLRVSAEVVSAWESGTSPVPAEAADDVAVLVAHADDQAEMWSAMLLDARDPVLRIPRDGDLDGWPAGWWRALAARVGEHVPGCRVVYVD